MIQVGRLGQADVDAAAGILFDAFGAAYRRRGHAPPFPTRESAAWLCRAYIDLDPEGCALARSSSEVVGVGFAHPRGAVTSIGPLASRPGAPAGVARALMGELGDDRRRLDQRSPVPGQLQPRLVRPLHTARLRRRPTSRPTCSPRGSSRPPPPPATPTSGRWWPRICRPSNATIDRAPAPTGAAISRCSRRRAAGSFIRRAARRESIAGYLFFRALPARVVIGPAVAESAEMLAALVDGVAASLPGRAAVIRASAAAPADAQARVRSRFSRRPPGQPDGARVVRAASGPALRAVSREFVKRWRPPALPAGCHHGMF